MNTKCTVYDFWACHAGDRESPASAEDDPALAKQELER